MKSILLYPLFVIGTFINDFAIHGIPVFYFIWFALVFIRISIYPIEKNEIFVQLVVLFFTVPAMVSEIFNFGSYWNYYVFIVLYVNFIFLLPFFINEGRKGVLLSSVALILIMSLISILFIVGAERRAVIGFGPNVLYRLHGMLYAFFLISAISSGVRSRVVYVSMTLLFLVNMVATGSRGAVVVVLLMAGFPVIFSVAAGLLRKLLWVYAAVVFSVIFYSDYIFSRFWRLFNFDIEGQSAGARVSYFSTAADFLAYDASWGDLIFGITSVNRLWDNYPHNFIVEALVYSGIVFSSLLFLSFLILFFKLVRGSHRVSFFIFSSSIVGSFFSGGLMNNFVAISFLFVVLVSGFVGKYRLAV